MNVTLFMAMSVNGIIAREDGSEDFLSHENWQTFTSLVNKFGNFIVGSRTYETVKNWNEEYGFDDFGEAKKIVVSDRPDYRLDKSYVLASSPENAIALLQKEGFEEALLTGGATNNASFANAGLINEIILNLEPVIIGKGIPLFRSDDFQLNVELMESKKVNQGLLQLHYRVAA